MVLEPAESPPPRRALLLLNRAARRGGHGRIVRDQLDKAGIAVNEPEIAGRDDVAVAIRAHSGIVDAVILGGGDGSLNAAAAAIAETGLPLGVLPMGTANDFARTMAIPLDPAAAVRVIAAGRKRRVDLGAANDQVFLNAASIGMSTRIARDLRAGDKRRFGVLAYGAAAARVLTRARAFHAEIEGPDGVDHVRAIQLTVGNGRHYGGMLTIRDDAEPDDGLLDLVAVRIDNWWQLPPLTPALLRGRYPKGETVLVRRAARFTIRTRARRDVDLDGDLLTATPVRFGIRRGAIEVFVPDA